MRNGLNFQIETKYLNRAISARKSRSCKTRSNDFKRTWTQSRGKETKRSLSTNKSLRRKEKLSTQRRGNSMRRARRPRVVRLSCYSIMSVKERSGSSSLPIRSIKRKTSSLRASDSSRRLTPTSKKSKN